MPNKNIENQSKKNFSSIQKEFGLLKAKRIVYSALLSNSKILFEASEITACIILQHFGQFLEKKEEILKSEENVVSDNSPPLKKDFHAATRNDIRQNVQPVKTAKKFSVFY